MLRFPSDFYNLSSVIVYFHSVVIQFNIAADIAEIPSPLSLFFLFQLPSGV